MGIPGMTKIVIGNHVLNILGYQWNPNSEDYQWRPCSAHEATKKNCPRGEPCLADTRYQVP